MSDEKKMEKHFSAGDRECRICGSSDASFILIQPCDDHDLETGKEELEAIGAEKIPFLLVMVPVLDWGRELVPWKAKAPYGNTDFGSDAAGFLKLITGRVIPQTRILAPDAKLLIGGYSLAGFFALWSTFQTDTFAGCAAASPSVWVDGWIPYAQTHAPLAAVYSLSLGDKEARAKNPLLRSVGTCMNQQIDIFRKDIDEKCGSILNMNFQMNPGNHFQNSGKRTGDAFALAMRMLMNTGKQ